MKTIDSLGNRVIALLLCIVMMVGMFPTSAMAVEDTALYGTVTSYTGGTVTGSGTANVEVLIENTTLQWVPANSLRAEGWWVGIDVVAPEGYSSDATYKVKSNPNAEYGEAKSFVGNKDGERDIQLWFAVSPESLAKFASQGRNLTMTYAFDWDGNKDYEQTVVFSVKPSEKIVLQKNGETAYPLGMVSTYTGGAVTGNGTANVEVLIEKTTLQWVPANSLRAEGWWVGIDVVAPEGYSSDATYKVKSNPNAEYGEAKSFVGNKDGERDIQLWFAVSPESLAKFASQGRNLTMTYAFDWDGNKDYEQTVVFSVKPSEKIVLQKNGETAYPLGMVSTYTGGTITGNGTANVEVLITDTTLNWSAADESTGRTQGWWVGIDVVAPEGYSSDATYKVKSNPDAEYGEAKSFAGKKDGERDIQLWFAVSPQSLKKFASEGRKLTMMYAFDWDGVNGYEQEITFSVDPAGNIILNKQEQAGFAYAEDTDVITYGDNENLYTILAPANAGLVAGNPVYSITGNEGEVQDNQDGTLKILKAGEVTITATLKGDDYYNDGTDSYVLTIKEAEQTGFAFDNPPSELTWQSTAVDALALINGKGEGAISWKITENDGVVATVDAEGKITLLKAGTFTIQAQKAGDACYNASDIISWTIEVKHRNQTGFSVASETITYNDVDKNAAAGTGRANVYTPIVSGGQTNGAVTYKLVSGDAVKIENNIINILKSGTVTIKATKAGNEQYNSTSAEFTLTIQKAAQSFEFDQAEEILHTYGVQSYQTKVKNVSAKNSGEWLFAVSTNSIGAEVDANGKVTFKDSDDKTGEVTVTVKMVEDDCYKEFSDTYKIKVNYEAKPSDPYVLLGDSIIEGSDWFTADVKIVAPSGYVISYGNALSDNKWEKEVLWTTDGYKDNWNNAPVIFLKNEETGGITDAISVDDLKRDTVKPYNLSISYTTDCFATIGEKLFGFHAAEVTVMAAAEDDTSGIAKIEYSLDNGADNTWKEAVLVNKAYTFNVPVGYRGQLWIKATDVAGNFQTYKQLQDGMDKFLVVDNSEPGLTVEYLFANDQKREYNNIYYTQGKTTIRFTIKEANFDLALETAVGETESAAPVATVNGVARDVTWAQTQGTDLWVGEITLSGNGDYVVGLNFTDRSKNTMQPYEKQINIDNEKPVISAAYGTSVQTVDGVVYYDEDQTAIIRIEEHNFKADEVQMTVTAEDVTGNPISISSKDYEGYAKNPANWTEVEEDIWELNTTGMKFDIEAIYSVKLQYTDLAEKVAEDYTADFVVDKTDPSIPEISYEKRVDRVVIGELTFDFYQPKVTVTLTSDDITAGVDYFQWNYTKEANTSEKNTESYGEKITQDSIVYTNEGKTATASFDIPANARGLISATVTDRSGNDAEKNDDVTIVVDKIAPSVSVTYTANSNDTKVQYINAEKATVGSFDKAYNVFYSGDVKAKIVIDEANFFEGVQAANGVIHQVGIKLTKIADDGVKTVTEYLPSGASQWYADAKAEYITWTPNGDKYSFDITYADNADYVLEIAYTDFSANDAQITANDGQTAKKTYMSKVITVDKSIPVVVVTYDHSDEVNNIGNRKYFNKVQSAKIEVTEHNFRASDFNAMVTAVDAAGGPVTVADFAAQLANEENWTHNGDVHTARIDYTVDANYTFDIEYQDLAKNPIVDRAQDLFTVDRKNPETPVAKYSTSVLEEIKESITFGYYNAQMTVTISAEDETSGIHYFIYSYIKKENVSNVNAELLEQKIENAEITYEGKKATASFKIPKLVLGKDNQFNGTVEVTAFDRSAHSSELKDTRIIVVDNIKPTATVTFNKPVQTANDISYYNGNIEATIVINEANFDAKDVVVTVTKDNVKYPVNVSWRDNSVDVHTGTFVLTEDGDYIVSVSYKDKSGNQMTDYKSNELTLDTTAPVIKASNIKANSANKDEKYGFVIEISDINLNVESMKPVLKAVVKGEDGLYKTVEIDLGKPVAVVNGQTYTYTVENLADDALYTLTCEAKDMSNNETIEILLDDGKAYEQVQFSINRNGSVFAYGTTYTENLVGQYYVYSVYEDVVIVEINVDPVEEYSVSLNGQELKEGTDYTTEQSSKTGEWSKRTYTIKKELFTEEGEYNIIVTSTDKANTIAYSDVKNLALAFVVDQTKPVLTITGLEAGGRYQTDEQTVILIPTDEGGRLNSLSVIVMNSNGEPLTDTNGKNISIRFEMAGEELLKYLEENDGKVTFTIPEGLNNKVQIICNDCAVNAENLTNEYNELFERVTVSQSQFVIFFANKPLFYGTIAGVLAIIALIIILIKRKKDKKNKRAVKA